jgi:hypothetical protein
LSNDKEETKEDVKEKTKQNKDWKTVKRAKDREKRMNARERTKQRLTMTTIPTPPKQTKDSTLFESEDEESADEDIVGKEDEDIVGKEEEKQLDEEIG